MTAGAGILHIERPPEQLIASGGLFHGIQLWVNLPAADKWIAPRYQGIGAGRRPAAHLARRRRAGAGHRGRVAGHAGPGATHTPISLVHATLEPRAPALVLPWPPRLQRAGLRPARAAATVGTDGRPLRTGQLAVLGAGRHARRPADAAQDRGTRRSTS